VIIRLLVGSDWLYYTLRFEPCGGKSQAHANDHNYRDSLKILKIESQNYKFETNIQDSK